MLGMVLAPYARRYLFYALVTDKIKPSDFSPKEIHRLWRRFDHEKFGKLLVAKGFAINALNKKGKTALISVLKSQFTNRPIFGRLDIQERLIFLLKNGAVIPQDDDCIEASRGNQENIQRANRQASNH